MGLNSVTICAHGSNSVLCGHSVDINGVVGPDVAFVKGEERGSAGGENDDERERR